MLGRSFEYREHEWLTPFLDTESRMSHKEREEIVLAVIDIYLDKERNRKIKGERYESMISKKGKVVFGGHVGLRYLVEVEGDFLEKNGKPSRLDFILIDLNDYSFN